MSATVVHKLQLLRSIDGDYWIIRIGVRGNRNIWTWRLRDDSTCYPDNLIVRVFFAIAMVWFVEGFAVEGALNAC